MSLLRVLGVVVAAVMVLVVVRLVSARSFRRLDFLVLFAAALLLLVSIDPAVVNAPEAMLRLEAAPNGRLIALLVLSSLASWLFVLWGRETQTSANASLGADIEALYSAVSTRYLGGAETGKFAVVIPAYNEAESLGALLPEIPGEVRGLPVEVVVVSDGSSDGTGALAAAAGATVLDLPRNRGGGAAIRIGYLYAVSHGARIVVTMDADGQHDPAYLEALITPILSGAADVVVGTRDMHSYAHASVLRAGGFGLFNRLLTGALRIRVTDSTSGFRAFNSTRIRRLETHERQYHTAEALIRLRRQGFRITEVPVGMRPRLHGQSKKGRDIVYGYRFARALLRNWFRG